MTWKDGLLLVAISVAWLVLNRWVLPSFGVATCMSGACTVDPRQTTNTETMEKPARPFSDSIDGNQSIKIPNWQPSMTELPDSTLEESGAKNRENRDLGGKYDH